MQKIVKLNRAFLYCCMVVLFCLQHEVYAAPTQGKPVSITIKNSSLADVLRQVSKKSGLYIYFQDADLAGHKNVSLDVKNRPVESVLHDLLDERGLAWVEVSENTIAVKKKPETDERKVEMDTVTTITVTGKVVDEKGEPVIGATVVVKNSGIGTTTNTNGSFILRGIAKSSALIISSVSYLTEVLPVNGRSGLGNIKLKGFIGELDETVVVAYGTTTKRFGTGNVASVKAIDIANQPVNNPLLTLQGRVPGLFVQQLNGISGGAVKVRVQGQNSIQSGSDPFYVVDGVPYPNQTMPTTTGGPYGILGNTGGGSGSPLSFISPNDIESIEILKDADATAIYGSRAANGAILITTKKGVSGRFRADISVQQGWGKVASKISLLNTAQYLQMRREAKLNDGESVNNSDYDINGIWDTTRSTDWQKVLLGETAKYTNVYASLSGGSDNVNYLVGASFNKENSVFIGDFANQKGGAYVNLNATSPNKRMAVAFTANYQMGKNRLPNADLTTTALQLAPDAPSIYNADGSLNWGLTPSGTLTFVNPLFGTYNEFQNKSTNLISNLTLSYNILEGLQTKVSLGYNTLTVDESTINPLKPLPPSLRPYINRTADYTSSNSKSWIIEPQLSYRRRILNGDLDVLVGSTFQGVGTDGNVLHGEGFNSDIVMRDMKSASVLTVSTTDYSRYKYAAAFGRVNYTYKNSYIINLTARRDGSSRFGINNQFHNFGAVGMAWIFSNTAFIQNHLSFLSFGKIRASYGTTGNDQIPNYRTLGLYRPVFEDIPYQGVKGLEIVNLSNPYLQWEETKKINVGLDIGMFNDRIFFTPNFSLNRSTNQLLEYNLPISTGFYGIITNFPATVQNTSMEFTINTVNIKTNMLTWKTNINLTIPRNKLVQFPNLATSSYSSQLIVGKSLSIQQLYNARGVNTSNGLYDFTSKSGNLVPTPDFESDRSVVMDLNPKYYGGISNNVSYKNWTLDILFQFVKQNMFDASKFGFSIPGKRLINQPATILDRWTKSGDVAAVGRYSSNNDLRDNYAAITGSDAAYVNTFYMRLKNVALSYALSDAVLKKMHISGLKCFVQAQNLFTITNFKGLDPESGNASLPPLRVINCGLQLSL